MSASLLLTLLTGCGLFKPDRPPDVVIVLVDTLRADAPSYAGNPRPTTPHLDELATKEATWFSRASAGSSWTLASTATLLTGLLPSQHRVVCVSDNPELFGRLDPGIPTLPSRLRERGYRSAAFINNAFLAPEFGLNRSFDLYNYEGPPNAMQQRSAAESVRLTLEWLAGSELPSLVLVHMMEPHLSYNAPPPFAGRFAAGMEHSIDAATSLDKLEIWKGKKETPSEADQAWLRASYDEEVLAVDDAIGALIAGLKQQDRWENTIFVVTADHGEEFWDYGSFEHGHTLRSAVTHVPLVVKAPGFQAGRNETVVDHLDLFQFLTENTGVLAEVARTGERRAGEVAIAEDLLYAANAVSIANEDLRLTVQLASKNAELYTMSPRWLEEERISDLPERRPEGSPLFQTMLETRGNLEPVTPNDPIEIRNSDTFDMLRNLGYIE